MAFWKQSSFYEKDVSNSAGDCFYTSAVGPTILTVFVQKFGDGLEKKNTALIETKPKKKALDPSLWKKARHEECSMIV